MAVRNSPNLGSLSASTVDARLISNSLSPNEPPFTSRQVPIGHPRDTVVHLHLAVFRRRQRRRLGFLARGEREGGKRGGWASRRTVARPHNAPDGKTQIFPRSRRPVWALRPLVFWAWHTTPHPAAAVFIFQCTPRAPP